MQMVAGVGQSTPTSAVATEVYQMALNEGFANQNATAVDEVLPENIDRAPHVTGGATLRGELTQMRRMNKWERVEAALRGTEVDRIPISLWKHYHLQDRAPGLLAEVTLALYEQFDIDLIKLTPSGLYPIQDWGATIQFGRDDDFLPLAVQPVITSAGQWEALPRLDVNTGALRRELEMIQHAGLGGAAPFLMTIFSPLNVAYKLCGDKVSGVRVFDYMRGSPRQLHAGLAVIAEVVRDYAAACLAAGASGFFFATQMASHDLMTPAEFSEFGVPYDRQVLDSLVGRSRVTMLHVCKQNLMFDLVADYPVDVLNWAALTSGTTLADARQMTAKPLAGGLSLETLLNGTEEDVLAEARQSIAQAGRTGFILAPDCVIRGPSPDANLAAARQAVEETSLA
jgi:uroporphyrinogen decarboxylase